MFITGMHYQETKSLIDMVNISIECEVMSILISFNKSSIYTMQPVLWEFECYSRNIAPLFVSVSVNTVTWFPLQLWSTPISTSPLADNREKKNRNVGT